MSMKTTPRLETERLILRPISLSDAPSMQKHFNNWNIIRFLSAQAPWPYPDDGSETFIREIALPAVEKGKAINWVIVPKDGADKGSAIGSIAYRFQDDGIVDRGFWLAEPYWKRGLMSEAVAVTQDFMFFDYGLKSFQVKNAQSNIGSRRVKEKNGGKFIRLEEERCGHLDEPTEVWEVTLKNWMKIRGKK